MRIRYADAPERIIDNVLSIHDLFDGKDFAFDFVVGSLNGLHPRVVNRVSDRVYFFLEGSGKAFVADKTFDVQPNDLIVVKAGVPHGLQGRMRYIIVTSPPFAPKNESILPTTQS